jgi:hypothetical protein
MIRSWWPQYRSFFCAPAPTTLLLLGVLDRAVMDVMGWSDAAMVKRCAHVTARLRRDSAYRLNAFSGCQMRLTAPNADLTGSSTRSTAWSEVVVRGRIEPPTFRFSGLRITVQDWPRWSPCLLSDPRCTPMDAGARGRRTGLATTRPAGIATPAGRI